MHQKILFVDDEPNILAGLQRSLRPLQNEWEMAFCNSGAEALAKLAQQPVDVVVSDMRMPGMNGTELLAEIHRRYPQVVRIMLSGYADRDLSLNSLVPKHQFIAKPCKPEAIKATIGRACTLRDLLAGNSLQQLLAQMQTLPSLPTLYSKLIEELRSPRASTTRFGKIIAQDVEMTVKILQIVNSTAFSPHRPISNPAEAVKLLGVGTIAALVLTIEIFSQAQQAHAPGFSASTLWNHSLRVGLWAQRIAQAEEQPAEVVQEAFTAGLLHETGHLLLAANLPRQYLRMLLLMRTKRFSSHEASLEVFGASHSMVGAYLLRRWELPATIVETVAFHDRPWYSLVPGFGPLTAVHVANALANEPRGGHKDHQATGLDLDYLTKIKLSARLPVWRKLCAQTARQARA
jgi:HD-like signal output (HDOD) protein